MRKLIAAFAMTAVMAVFLFAAVAFAGPPSQKPRVDLPDWSKYAWEIEHKVKPGEFLFMIAGYYYKDGRKWNWVYDLNRNKIVNPNLIKPGQKLIIKVPRGWSPPMPYAKWYERNREHYVPLTAGERYGVGPPGTEGPEGYVTEEPASKERVNVHTPVKRVKKKVGAK